MTDAEIRASKWQHAVQRVELRRLVRESTPSRTFWDGGIWMCDSCQAAWTVYPACKASECPIRWVSK